MAGEERDSGGGLRSSFSTRSAREGLWRKLQTNLKAKNAWQEASGSLGDIGTFVPLLLAMALVNGLDFGTTLVFTGLYNLVTGGLFGVPMPVQPMKSIAAVAITEGNPLTVPQIMAAGICTASLVLFLGATGLMGVVQRYVPLPVVRGIQVSQGISFGNTAVKYILQNQDFATSKATTSRAWFGYDGFVLAMGAISFVVLVSGAGARNPSSQPQQSAPTDVEEGGESSLERPLVQRTQNEENELRPKGLALIPSALIVFLVGVLIAIIRDPRVLKAMRFGPSPLGIVRISLEDWKTGFVRAAIPQIPLTILNSVVAVCKLSNDLLPRKKDVTPAAVSISVGVMNLVGCWFGAMPVCHGAGGLAGQYRFGARSGLSVAMLGTAKLVLGLVLGSSLLQLLGQFPIGLLGALLLFSGVELAMACRDQTSRLDSFVMLVVIVVSLGSSSAASGFGCDIGLWMLIKIHEWSSDSRII